MAMGTLALCFENHKVFTGALLPAGFFGRAARLRGVWLHKARCMPLPGEPSRPSAAEEHLLRFAPPRCLRALTSPFGAHAHRPQQRLARAGVVKMRRGQTAKLMLRVNDMREVFAAFAHFAELLAAKCAPPPARAQMRLCVLPLSDAPPCCARCYAHHCGVSSGQLSVAHPSMLSGSASRLPCAPPGRALARRRGRAAARRCDRAVAGKAEAEDAAARVRAIQAACAAGLRLPPGAAGGPRPQPPQLGLTPRRARSFLKQAPCE